MRPLPAKLVLIVCAFELLGLLLYPSAILSEASAKIGLWYQIYIGLSALAAIFAIWKLWKMKKLGVFFYLAMYLVHNLVAVIAGNWQVPVLIIPVIGVALLLPNYKKMV
ncbi:MAG: hypothetical protein ACEPO8_09535 [Rhodothermaceae bacterium]